MFKVWWNTHSIRNWVIQSISWHEEGNNLWGKLKSLRLSDLLRTFFSLSDTLRSKLLIWETSNWIPGKDSFCCVWCWNPRRFYWSAQNKCFRLKFALDAYLVWCTCLRTEVFKFFYFALRKHFCSPWQRWWFAILQINKLVAGLLSHSHVNVQYERFFLCVIPQIWWSWKCDIDLWTDIVRSERLFQANLKGLTLARIISSLN